MTNSRCGCAGMLAAGALDAAVRVVDGVMGPPEEDATFARITDRCSFHGMTEWDPALRMALSDGAPCDAAAAQRHPLMPPLWLRGRQPLGSGDGESGPLLRTLGENLLNSTPPPGSGWWRARTW